MESLMEINRSWLNQIWSPFENERLFHLQFEYINDERRLNFNSKASWFGEGESKSKCAGFTCSKKYIALSCNETENAVNPSSNQFLVNYWKGTKTKQAKKMCFCGAVGAPKVIRWFKYHGARNFKWWKLYETFQVLPDHVF